MIFIAKWVKIMALRRIRVLAAQTLIANVEGLYAELLGQKKVNFHER